MTAVAAETEPVVSENWNVAADAGTATVGGGHLRQKTIRRAEALRYFVHEARQG